MENEGFQSDAKNENEYTALQRNGQPNPPPPAYGQPNSSPPGFSQPYPSQPGFVQSYYPPQPANGQPYYPPQTANGQPYPSQPGYGQPQPGYGYPNAAVQSNAPYNQNQQQQVVVVGAQPTPVFVAHNSPVSMVGAIALSCIVIWFCGWILGLIAFILAMVGQSSATAGDIAGAIRLRNASYGVSIAGIVFGIITIAVVATMVGRAASVVVSNTNCYYYYNRYYYSYTC